MKTKCPHCKSEKFISIHEKLVTIELEDDGSTLTDDFIEDRGHDYKCANCGKDVTEEDLIK